MENKMLLPFSRWSREREQHVSAYPRVCITCAMSQDNGTGAAVIYLPVAGHPVPSY